MMTRGRAVLMLLGLIAAAGTATAQDTVTNTYSYSGGPIPILRDSADTATLISIVVPTAIKIEKVTVMVDVEYPKVGDINLYVYSAAGTRTKLLERDCGDRGTLRRTTFDDAAETKYKDFCPVEAGRTFRGNEPLSNSVDEVAMGVWTLLVENNGSDDFIGWVHGFSVTITGKAATNPTFVAESVRNSASLAGGPIAPGEMISIFGLNLGPDRPVEAEGPELPVSLGDTTVAMGNDSAVPIKYASRYRVDVQVPYAMGVGGSVPVVVYRGAQGSNVVYLNVVAAAPGIVTKSPTGVGQIVALNADGTQNDVTNPALRGTTVQVKAYGLGITLPVSPAGEVPRRPGPAVYYPVTASVAGSAAEVVSATLENEPGQYLVTIRIPSDAPTGALNVKLSSTGSSSQNDAWVFVR